MFLYSQEQRKEEHCSSHDLDMSHPTGGTLKLACLWHSHMLQFRDVWTFTVQLPVILTPKDTWENGERAVTTFLFHHQTKPTNQTYKHSKPKQTQHNKTSLKPRGRILCLLLSFLSAKHIKSQKYTLRVREQTGFMTYRLLLLNGSLETSVLIAFEK